MMKRLAVAFLIFLWGHAVLANCALVGAPLAVGTTYSPSVTSRTITITTSGPGLVILHVSLNAETAAAGPVYPTVTSVTGGGLTWQSRFQNQATVAACYLGPSDCFVDVEEWSAVAAVKLSAAVITVNAAMNLGYGNLMIWAVGGTSNFDGNSSVPAFGSDLSGSTSEPTVAGVSTNNANDIIFFMCDGFANGGPGPACGGYTGFPTPNSPWSIINDISQGNIFISFYNHSTSLKFPATIKQVSQTFTPYSPKTSVNWIAVVDAVECSGGNPQVWSRQINPYTILSTCGTNLVFKQDVKCNSPAWVVFGK